MECVCVCMGGGGGGGGEDKRGVGENEKNRVARQTVCTCTHLCKNNNKKHETWPT